MSAEVPVKTAKVVVQPEEKGDPLEYLSASRLKSYLTCPLGFYFEKVLAIPRPASAAAHLDKAVHASLASYHTRLWRGEEASAETIAGRFGIEFSKLEDAQPVKWGEAGDRFEAMASGERLVRAYIEDESARAQPKPIGVEVTLDGDIPGVPIPLLGVADLVREGNRLTDFKTTAVTPNPGLEAWQHELQLTAYDLLIEANTGEPVSESELVFLVKTKTHEDRAAGAAGAGRGEARAVQGPGRGVCAGRRAPRVPPVPRPALRVVPVSQRVRPVEGSRCVMLMRTVPFLVFLVVLVMLPTGCGGSPPPPPDFPNLASAFKFVGCCSVACACLWAYAIVTGSNNRKGGG